MNLAIMQPYLFPYIGYFQLIHAADKFVFYDDVNEPYDGLSLSLEKLGNAIRTENQRLWKLGFSSKNLTSLDNDQFSFGLEILAGSMPSPRKKECNVFSAGSQGSLLLSGQGKEFINKYYSENGCYDSSRFVECKNKLVSRYAETDLFAAVARDTRDGVSSSDSRNLKKVSQAIEETLKETNGKYEVINIMLLAAGKGKIFPPVYSFIQMIRGYKNFIKNHDLQSILKIHVVDPSVTSYFRTNSLEIEELLNCDDMRINIEIQDIDEIERYQIYLNSEKSLETVSEFYSINRDKWNVRIAPTPFKNQTITPDCQASLEDIGLIPGSMIIYSKK